MNAEKSNNYIRIYPALPGNAVKIKLVIIIFNILMLFFIAVILALPLLILGSTLAGTFWRSSWFFAPLILAAIALINLYFILNYRIYTLLEKEDWPALIMELEKRVLQKNNFNPRLVILLIHVYLVLSDTKSVTEMEKTLSVSRKKLVSRYALSFGAARILQKDYQGAADLFAASLENPNKSRPPLEAEWLRWYYGFSLLLSRRFKEASDVFILLTHEGREGILVGLSAYFLHDSLSGFLPLQFTELKKIAKTGCERVKMTLPRRIDWDNELKNNKTEIYLAIIQSYTEKTADFLYQS